MGGGQIFPEALSPTSYFPTNLPSPSVNKVDDMYI